MTDHGQQHDGDYDVWGADFGKVGIDGVTDNRLRPDRAPDRPERGGTLRAAQETAVRDVIGTRVREIIVGPPTTIGQFAAEIVDAVLGAGGLTLAPDHIDAAINALTAVADDEREPERYRTWYAEALAAFRRARTAPTPDQLDQAHADGYAAAVAERVEPLIALIRDFVDPTDCWYDHHGGCQGHGWGTVGGTCPHARAKTVLADYLEDIGPTAAQETQDGAEVGRSGGETGTGGSGDEAAVCTCPDIDSSTFHEPPGTRTVKGLDPNCPLCGGDRG